MRLRNPRVGGWTHVYSKRVTAEGDRARGLALTDSCRTQWKWMLSGIFNTGCLKPFCVHLLPVVTVIYVNMPEMVKILGNSDRMYCMYNPLLPSPAEASGCVFTDLGLIWVSYGLTLRWFPSLRPIRFQDLFRTWGLIYKDMRGMVLNVIILQFLKCSYKQFIMHL